MDQVLERIADLRSRLLTTNRHLAELRRRPQATHTIQRESTTLIRERIETHRELQAAAQPAQAAGASGGKGLLESFDINPYKMALDAAIEIGKAYWESVKSAAAWDSEMKNVNKTTKLNKADLAALSNQVKEIGANNSLPLQDAPKTFDKLVKAGLSAGDALNAFDPALKAIKASGSDADTVISAMTNTLKSGGASNAKEMFDIMFATVDKGKASFEDIAKVFPDLAESAKGAGLSFKDSAGMLAFLTQTGRNAESSATVLKESFTALSDPRFEKSLAKIGVNVKDSTGNLLPLQNVIGDLKESFKGLNEEQIGLKLQKMGMEDNTASGLTAMITGYDSLKESIKTCNESQGSLNDAFANAESPMDVWSVVGNQLSKEMMDLGALALPFLKEAGVYVLQLIQGFKDWWNSSAMLRDIFSLLWERIQISFKLLILPIKRIMNLAEGLGKVFGWVAEQIGLSGTSFESLYATARPYLLYIWELMNKIADIGYKFVSYDFSGAVEAFKNFKLPSLDELKAKSNQDIQEHKSRIPGYGVGYKDQLLPQLRPYSTLGFQFFKPKDELEKTTLYKKPKPGPTDTVTKPTTPKAAVGATTGRAEQIKNLTINMDAMVKMGDFVSTNSEVSKMGKRELEQWFMELCARMIRNMEMSYS